MGEPHEQGRAHMASCFLVLLIQTTSSSSSVSLAMEGAVLRRTSLCLSHHIWKQIRHSATCCWHLTEKNKIIFFYHLHLEGKAENQGIAKPPSCHPSLQQRTGAFAAQVHKAATSPIKALLSFLDPAQTPLRTTLSDYRVSISTYLCTSAL